ncbi:MAG TPA: ChaB family protein [Nitrososphaeraceae archaeon]|nr:ChaB family protein [Nitrososphaeraceae archaeon]
MSKSKVQGKKRASSSSGKNRQTKSKDKKISARTKKQIDSLPEHAQHIYKKAHASAIDQYQNPERRRGGARQSAEEVAHKTAWAAVKEEYKKKGDKWVRKEE